MKHQTIHEKLVELDRKLAEAKAYRQLIEVEGWKLMASSVQARIVEKINRVCSVECQERETLILRAEIQSLRWFLRIQQISPEQIAKWAKELEGLRSMVLRRQNLGITDPDATTEDVSGNVNRLAQEIEALP